MSFWDRLFGRKYSEARTVLTINQIGQPQQTPKNYENFAREAYQANSIAFKAISFLARACGAIEWKLLDGPEGNEITTHPLLDLWNKPNPLQGSAAFVESMVAYLKISGNSYVEAVRATPNKPPKELWSIRPDKMKVIPGGYGMPSSFQFQGANGVKTWPVDPITGISNVMQIKTFHPINPWYGLSPIEAAMYAIDQHNASSKWNLSLLQNMGTPSGAIAVEKKDGSTGILTDEQYSRLKEEIQNKVSGPDNAGRPMLLEGGMKWMPMAITPKEMDWIQGRNMSARDIALVFGVPPLLLNIPGDSTYSNYKEARLAVYEDTIIPTIDFVKDELNRWVVPMFGDGLYLEYKKNKIDALVQKRLDSMTNLKEVTWWTINEKREVSGLENRPDGDVLDSGQVSAKPTVDPGENQPQPGTSQGNGSPEDNDPAELDEPTDQPKQINPFGKGDRVRIWKSMNAKRNKFAAAMKMDVQDEMHSLAKTMGEIKTTDPRLAEYHAHTAIESMCKSLLPILERHQKRAYAHFGNAVLDSGKDVDKSLETKTEKFQTTVTGWGKSRALTSIAFIQNSTIKIAKSKIQKIIVESTDPNIQPSEVGKKLSDEFMSISESRADSISNHEIRCASNQGSLEAAKQLEIPGLMKEWVASPKKNSDSRDSHDQLSGSKVAIHDHFSVNGEAMDCPGDPTASSKNTLNCDCVLVYSKGAA